MNFAYDWAFAKPIRKIYYNLTITGLSVFISLFIGTVEIVGLIVTETGLDGGFWNFLADFNIYSLLNSAIVGVFVLTWMVARHLALRPGRAQMGARKAARRQGGEGGRRHVTPECGSSLCPATPN